jgi:arabinose-5-phosphate isomerase
MGNKLIGMTSNRESFLALHSDFVFHAYAEKEACPNNLAPTTSTTAQLVLGDALAVALLDIRSFTSNDFARYHPGGSLGKKLYLRVDELVQEQKPQVLVDSSLHEVIIEISSKRLGAVAVLKDSVLVGLVTDGDLRRMLQKTTNLEGVCAADIMTHNPKSIDASSLAAEALAIMEECNITQLIVLENGSYKGLIHLHDILKEGII